jgi:drug/metabolite transporter (DMT)-like permease
MSKTNILPALTLLLLSIIAWAASPVFIQLLSDAYDPFSQAFVRYASACVVLVPVCALAFRRESAEVLSQWRALTGVATLNVMMQVAWTLGCYTSSSATITQLITRLNVVFVIILSFIVFHEERAVIKSPGYIIGTLVSFLGMFAVLMKDEAQLVPHIDPAAGWLLLSALLWACYMVYGKHVVTTLHPVPMFTVVAAITTVELFAIALVAGRPSQILHAGGATTFVAFVSGVFPIALAHSCYHNAQKTIGAAASSSFIFLIPLFTYLIARIALPSERLTPMQWIGGAILLGGTLLVARTAHRIHKRQRDERLEEVEEVIHTD